ncbi:single-stranded-DNA-specific exonuclease RecJ [Candidatus Saccharibacteria bacterium]|nr:single-stranded-DNA-specific exonuclease RecJ [Candidatus Saccharibacteria bacterium]
MNKLFTQVLEKRHIDDDFLHPDYAKLSDPFEVTDMDKAINRIEKAITRNEKILIYGDYDVDGVTASTLMENALLLAGVQAKNIEIMLPDRFIDGYGMSARLITRAKDDGVNLVITVDCGSRNHDIIDELNSFGIDTIVTDHHECVDTLPKATAVINPHRHDYSGPDTLRCLAGVGVAFKLAQALVNKNFIKSGQEKWLLDLVLLGTICDSMQLTGENRILTYYGAKVLEKTRRKGLQELMRLAEVKTITSEAIGFRIGPRLNSAGRLETAELSLNLLRTNSAATAASIAAKLESLNKKRRDEQRAATEEIATRHQNLGDDSSVIIETGDWHEGILGIVAGRLVENYHKPAFVLSRIENNVYKGSGRSFGDFNLADALNYAGDTIIKGGGHAAACGVMLESGNLDAFREKINEYYRGLHLSEQEKYLKIPADLTSDDLGDFTLDFLSDLSLLEPFGPGNNEPVFQVTGATILDVKRMGNKGQHLRLDLKDKDGKTLKCIAFFAPESWFNLYDDVNYSFLVRPVENEFRGTRSVEARLIDVIF